MSDLQPVQCQKCQKVAEEGDVHPGAWYWSDRDECWYCKPCEGKLVSEMLAEMKSFCKEKDIPVMDLHGNRIDQN